jgi:hypothetical protein
VYNKLRNVYLNITFIIENMNVIFLFLLILNVFFLYGDDESQNPNSPNIIKLISNKNNTDCETVEDKDEISEIYIFVHGTADGIGSYCNHFGQSGSWEGFKNNVRSKFIKKEKYQNLYDNSTKFSFFKDRKKHLLVPNFPMMMGIYPGLSEIKHPVEDCNEKDKCKHCISQISYKSIFLLFKNNQEKLSGEKNKRKFFMFNWVGSLSSIDRSCAAEKFNEEIKELSIKYPFAKINIFTHSHGGTVTLEALSLSSEKYNINNIICLGMPIGEKTYQWIEKITCNNIYNFYSHDDIAQNKDITFDKLTYFKGRKIKFKGRKIKNLTKVHNVEVQRKDKQKVHHGMFYIVNDKKSIFPVVCDIPLFIALFKNKNHPANMKLETFETDDYIYIIS